MDSNHNLWQIKIYENKNTNCAVPQDILNNALRSDQIKLPLLFKIIDPVTKHHIITAADDFFETQDNDTHEIKLSPIIIKHLNISDCAFVELINNKIDLVPPKAKKILLEPQDELFYKLKNPQKILEKYLKHSYIVGVNYMIPLELKLQVRTNLKIKVVHMRIDKLIDQFDKETIFVNINNVDLVVDFLPIPEHLQKKKTVSTNKKHIVPKKPPTEPPNTDNNLSQTNNIHTEISQAEKDPLYDPSKRWIPFCGWGRVLSSGNYVKGIPQLH